MSVISPPEPNLDTFNNTYWTTDDIPLTQAEANKLYLKYPIAQGTQTLQAVNINGTTTINNQNLVITDGTNTNTISKSGYTTRNSVQNITHYLNFSDSSTTGVGNIQKTAGITCNPSTNNITATTMNATTFTGSLSGNATSATSATTATNANNILITSDNTAATYYIPFAKTSGTGNKPLFFDDTTTQLTYNPANSILGINSASISQSSTTGHLTISNASTVASGGNVDITASTSASALGNITLTTSSAPSGGNITISALGAQGTNGNLTLATRSGTPAVNRGFILSGAATLTAAATAAASVDLVLTINGTAYRVALKAI
jgi:hypothetical protein